MDVDAIMERVLKSNDDTNVRVQVGDSNRKRMRTDGSCHSTKECSSSKLIHRKRGKRPVTFEKESTPPVPSTLYETQDESAITPANVSPLPQSPLGMLIPYSSPSVPPFLTFGLRQPLSPWVKASGLFP
ncbi:hypothetical protein GOBAR_DD23625 [Gossypium barbadense]|nr:hypothetical protein GOBAR_DD23625 [Gossypium barbadense]